MLWVYKALFKQDTFLRMWQKLFNILKWNNEHFLKSTFKRACMDLESTYLNYKLNLKERKSNVLHRDCEMLHVWD